jgi:hypothetical protein
VFVEGGRPAELEGLVDTITFPLGLPDGVAVNEIVVRPTGQLRT